MRAGDVLWSINGQPLRDIIDVRFYSSDAQLELLWERAGERRTCTIGRRYGEPLGLAFAEDLFNGGPRVCRNNCTFCFVAQMAPELRAPLYVKDDDYRLSFLHGNYITLTNLSPQDWDRIEEQYLSPLYVSVHATEPAVRVDLLRNPRAGAILTDLTRLVEAGIEVHTQAVLVPGRNDGPHLDHTISDLAALYPGVQDLSVVPVGLTRWHAPDLRIYTEAESGALLDQVLRWQGQLRGELGVGFVYPSDEWFLRAGRPAPAQEAYDGLLPAMIENGVGMVRRFLDTASDLERVLEGLGTQQTWITGTLFAPTLEAFAAAFVATRGVSVDVVPVVNAFFGSTVTVAGLLTVQDILAALAQRELGDVVVVPGEVFRGPQERSLDDTSPTDLSQRLGRPVCLLACDGRRWSVEAYG
jgi:putative radical SAM enzyme (TIGR03279 family)